MGDDTASLGLVNLMLRYNQAQMQSLYASFMGDNMWRPMERPQRAIS
ncbi:MAG: hypothetical protein ACLR2E_20235 [Lachnospiraceae bacterium]